MASGTTACHRAGDSQPQRHALPPGHWIPLAPCQPPGMLQPDQWGDRPALLLKIPSLHYPRFKFLPTLRNLGILSPLAGEATGVGQGKWVLRAGTLEGQRGESQGSGTKHVCRSGEAVTFGRGFPSQNGLNNADLSVFCENEPEIVHVNYLEVGRAQTPRACLASSPRP